MKFLKNIFYHSKRSLESVNKNVILSESGWFLNKPVEQDKPIKIVYYI